MVANEKCKKKIQELRNAVKDNGFLNDLREIAEDYSTEDFKVYGHNNECVKCEHFDEDRHICSKSIGISTVEMCERFKWKNYEFM